jgi:ribosomal protein S27AE
MQPDGFESAQQPRCARCVVLMRPVDDGWSCSCCGLVESISIEIVMPPAFVGSGIHGG